MTTAHRPTWKAAVGRAQEGGWSAGGATSAATSALDAPAHTKLKVRKGAQVVDRKKSLRESLLKLEQAEAKAPKIGRRQVEEDIEEEGKRKLLKQIAEVDDARLREKYDDKDADDGGGIDDDSDGWSNVNDDSESDLDASDSDEDEDSEDEEAALQAELGKIRAEREAAKAKAEAEEVEKEEAKMGEAAMLGNPLLVGAREVSGRMKRRWNDDVVFRNQARGESKLQKRFINDTVRNDFHKRFLNKFIR